MSVYLLFSLAVSAALILGPGLLDAEEPSGPPLEAPAQSVQKISDEKLANMKLTDTDWECGNPDRRCAHILIDDNDSLLCIPVEIINDCLMIPLDHFRYIGGFGLETDMDGHPRLLAHGLAYSLKADSPILASEGKTWSSPVAPYEAHGFLYVPFRFLCEALGMDVQWRPQSGAVLLRGPQVDSGRIAGPIAELNRTLLAAIDEEEWQARLELVDMTVTFYASDNNPPYTASGNIAVAGSIAADRGIPFGAQYYIPELAAIKADGIFTVHDRGGAVTGNLLDVFIPSSLYGDPEVNAMLRRGRFKTVCYRIRPEG